MLRTRRGGRFRIDLAQFERAVAGCGMERLTRLGAVIAAFFACFLVAGTDVAATGEQLCRQLEAELAAASSAGDAMSYGEYDEAIATAAPTVRARLLASLEANGCRDGTEPQQQVLPPMEDAGLDPSPLEQMLDDGTGQQDIPEEQMLRDTTLPSQLEELRALGSYRTVCVRICDGYHFPISTASSMSNFEADQRQCEATCPGTEVELFYQDAGDEDPRAMVSSVSGLTYEELQAASRFRREHPARGSECRCKPAAVKAEETPEQPYPSSITTLGAASTSAPTKLPPPGERKVRVVGPVFFPDREGAIDLRAPGRKNAP